jgi:UDPglucose 6-dehydrogenase
METPKAILNWEVKNVCCIGAGFVVGFPFILTSHKRLTFVKGGPTGAVLAAYVEDIDVTVVDINTARIDAWNSNDLPVSESGLFELLLQCRMEEANSNEVRSMNDSTAAAAVVKNLNEDVPWYTSTTRRRNLRFSADIDDAIRRADLIFLCIDTPQAGNDGNGQENPPDLTNFKKAVRRIGEVAIKDFIVVEKSTVPPGAARLVSSILSSTLRCGISYDILSNPEFMAEGTAVRDLTEPDRVLIGSSPTPQGLQAARVLAGLYENWIPTSKILTVDTWSSELSKLCANALLAQRISSINSISMICETVGADIRQVSEAIKMDHRIGSQMLSASVGFGGSCFQKDIAHLVYLARSLGLDHVARYWKSVLEINQMQKESFANRISRRLAAFSGLATEIAVLGFAFKPETNDARCSPAIDVVKRLMEKHYHVRVYDPCVSRGSILEALGTKSCYQDLNQDLTICSSPYEACRSASAVVILTDWKEFRFNLAVPCAQLLVSEHQQLDRTDCFAKEDTESYPDSGLGTPMTLSMERLSNPLDWQRICQSMIEPRYLFDGRNIVDDAIVDYGFRIERIGKTIEPLC